MFKPSFNLRVNFLVICALIAMILLTACGIDTPANIPLQGSYSRGNWQINLNDSSGSGTFTKVGSEHHQVGESFFTTDARINYNTWHGVVYDKNFKSMKQGTITIDRDKLVITPDGNKAYILMRTQINSAVPSDTTVEVKPVRERVRSKKRFYTGNLTCSTEQCLGITQLGIRCKRDTRDCSGYCFQH